MLNIIWSFMIVGGILYGAIQGQEIMGLLSDGAVSSAGEAVELCVTMLGIVGLWSGIMNIAKESGLVLKLTKGMEPLLHFLFPDIPKDNPVLQDIATNMIANILGLGWAATPAGIKAIKGLQALNEKSPSQNHEKRRATDEMCTFLVINISSLQLIPVNIIAYRSRYGAAEPASIIGPALFATLLTTIAAIILCKIMCSYNRKKRVQNVQKSIKCEGSLDKHDNMG